MSAMNYHRTGSVISKTLNSYQST